MVSIVCDVYNHGKYLRDTLEGFVSQKTNFPFEILVHDDASTDDSAKIIREYEEKYPEIIKPIYQVENQYSQKVPIDRTFQIPRIQGKYVAVCEGDDYWTDPLKLQKQYDFMEANPEYAMCTCSVVWLDMRTNKQVNLCATDHDKDVSLEDIILETKGRIFQYASFFTKKNVFCIRHEWMKHFGVGDTPLAMNAALQGKVRMLADCMAVYRNHAEGSWTSRIDGNIQYKEKAFLRMIDGLTRFNEATAFEYDEVVSCRIKRIRYNIARANRDLMAMRSDELREIYLSRPLMARLSDVLYCLSPDLQTKIRRILGR